MKNLNGTGVALVTPFQADLQIDFDALKRLVRHVSQKDGVDFLVVMGTTGESATLSEKEQTEVITSVIQENAGKLPVVLGCGGNNTLKVISKMKELEAAFHPEAFLSVCPYYNKPSQEGLYQHFREIARNTSTPIILYNVPARTSSNLLPDTAIRLAKEFSHIISVKEASGNIEQMMDIISKKPAGFELLSGDDGFTLPVVACGATGLISVTANALPVEMSSVTRLAMQGDFSHAKNLHYKIWNSIQLNFREGNPAGIKAMLSVLGICEPHVRLPLVAASKKLAEDMREELIRSGLLQPFK